MFPEKERASASFRDREPSSFRDKDGFVFYERGTVFRKITNNDAVSSMKNLLASNLYCTLKNRIIHTTICNDIMTHEKVEVITYPYEWSFSMLADAALIQLEIIYQGLKEGYLLKDGSAFNCFFHKGHMVFIDLLSIGNASDNTIWDGYHQFCEHFIYPLMLKAYKGINFQSIWRGNADGIPTSDFCKMVSFFDYFKQGVLMHCVLKNKLSKLDVINTKIEIKRSDALQLNTIGKLVNNLIGLVKNLRASCSSSIWTDYAHNNTYTDGKYEQKKAFVEKYVKTLCPNFSIVDLGCNTGDFSEIASKYARIVKSVDFDADCIDRIYLKIRAGTLNANVVPIVSDLMNISPPLGWELEERKDLITRLKSDAFLALALIHHLCISKNLPIFYFAKFLRKVAPEGIIEWVGINDPMVKGLLKNRKNIFSDYTWENFTNEIQKFFLIEQVFDFEGTDRKLCIVKSK